jgi:hypothetical protein
MKLKVKHSDILKIVTLIIVSFLFLFFSCDYDAIQEYEIENNLSTTLFVKIANNGSGLNLPYLIHDSVESCSTKVIFRQAAGISTYPKADEDTRITELCLFTLNGNDTIKSNVDYSKNQNMEYYFRNKTTGVYLIKVGTTDFYCPNE